MLTASVCLMGPWDENACVNTHRGSLWDLLGWAMHAQEHVSQVEDS